MKKKQESKQEKTITAHEKAFKAAERKTRQQLSQVASCCSDTLHMMCWTADTLALYVDSKLSNC